MKKLIALLLALMLALALAVPASAAGEDIGIIGGADGPTYILVSADPKAAATVSKEQREQNIKALGGVAGQVNVLLGDRCIAFTDAVPEVKNGRTMVPLRAALEAMGARIEFDQATKTAIVTGEKASFTHVVGSDVITRADGSTVKMDVHSYVTPSNRTMVPVRFFSQVLGYDVFWDNGYRMAFLLDEETFAEKVDSRLTILNGYLAGNAKRFDASKNYKEDVTLSGTVKVIDSIKGDRSYPYSGKASVLLGKDGMSMSMSADLSDLAELSRGACRKAAGGVPRLDRQARAGGCISLISSTSGPRSLTRLMAKANAHAGCLRSMVCDGRCDELPRPLQVDVRQRGRPHRRPHSLCHDEAGGCEWVLRELEQRGAACLRCSRDARRRDLYEVRRQL